MQTLKKDPFIHLRLHSAYSLAEGAITHENLVLLCKKHNMPAVAVTDTNNLFGALEFSIKCSNYGIQSIIGCQLNIQHTKPTENATSVLLYAKNQNGYLNLIKLVTQAYLSPTSDLYPEISLDYLSKYSEDLILLTGGIYGSLGRLLAEDDIAGAKEYLHFLNSHFADRLYIELSRHNFQKENDIEEKVLSLAYDLNIPLVATNNVCYAEPDAFNAHDALICISQSKTIYDPDRATSSPEFYFKSGDQMREIFRDLPEAILNTSIIAQRCAFKLEPKAPIMPQFHVDDGKTQGDALRDMATDGLVVRLEKFRNTDVYEQKKEEYFDRLNYELNMIEKMGFSGYFLIVADYVRWAKSQKIPVGPGRGSGAGSIVAWSVQITDVDPMRFQLFFERFLNPDRISMPDFDIDFCQSRRDEVIFYVQRKYGYNSVAQIVTFGKLQAKAVIKDVGRVLAMPYGLVDTISKMIPFHPTNPLTLQQAIDSDNSFKELIESDAQVKTLIEIALRLEGLYRHASVHAAGIVISDKILQDLVPLYKDPKSHMPATQFSMKYVENAGLIKFDFLGLKTLTVIQKVIDILAERGVVFNIQDISLDDAKTFDLFHNVNCVGVFQIESTGMRDVLKKMRPDRVEDLIALVALYRPGPMDDIPKYIACKHGTEQIEYLHEKLEPILSETYGVMVYQEQVMQIAQVIGGYTLGQADILRRAMGKKNKEEMLAQQKRFVDGAVMQGVSLEVAQHLFELMNKFAGYGFNKSHSTPYGLLTYQTAYLKANYMIEFFATIMALDLLNTDKLYVYYRDAKSNGITIDAPDINFSSHDFIIDYSRNAIAYSLSAIKGSGENAVIEIVKERTKNGPFLSIFDFAERLSNTKVVNRRMLENLIKAGAFDKLHANRRQLFNSMDQILSVKITLDQVSLFEKSYPELSKVPEWDNIEKLQHEFSAIGFYISAHPMEKYEEELKAKHYYTIIEAKNYHKAKIAVIINNVLYKTTKNQNKFCILQVSDASGVADMSMFSDVLANNRNLLVVGNVVEVVVTVYSNNEQVRMIIDDIKLYYSDFKSNTHIEEKTTSAKSVQQKTSQQPIIKKRIIRINISNIEQLHKIKRTIDNFRTGGNSNIELLVDAKKLTLTQQFFLTSYDILDLKNIVGADNVNDQINNL